MESRPVTARDAGIFIAPAYGKQAFGVFECFSNLKSLFDI